MVAADAAAAMANNPLGVLIVPLPGVPEMSVDASEPPVDGL
jgi:hypothetical protein